MKHLITLTTIIIILFSGCTKENSLAPQPQGATDVNDLRVGRSEIHIAVLSFNSGETKFGNKGYTFHLSANYQDSGNTDSATIVNQLWHVNDVCNYGASQDKHHYPYANYLFNNYQGNKIAEIPISIKLVQDTAAAKIWITRICDNGYAPHTLLMNNTPNDLLKVIYPNL